MAGRTRGPTQTQFHPSKRRKLLATADVAIYQATVVDKNRQIRTVVVWQCGPDILYASSMDGLFDGDRRRTAPDWLREQLEVLPTDKQFTYLGEPKQAVMAEDGEPKSVSIPKGTVSDGPLEEDDEVAGVAQA